MCVQVKEGTSPSVVGKMIMEFGLAEKAKPNAEEEDMAKDIGTVAFKGRFYPSTNLPLPHAYNLSAGVDSVINTILLRRSLELTP